MCIRTCVLVCVCVTQCLCMWVTGLEKPSWLCQPPLLKAQPATDQIQTGRNREIQSHSYQSQTMKFQQISHEANGIWSRSQFSQPSPFF